jgi:hypothetical protein
LRGRPWSEYIRTDKRVQAIVCHFHETKKPIFTICRDEELKMDSAEHRGIISSGVTAAVKEFCDTRWGMLGPI